MAERLINLTEAAKRAKNQPESTSITVDILEALEDRLDKQEAKIERDQTRSTEVLGIFVALFTFISINVQIFSRLTDLASAMWFMLVMGGVMVVLLLVLETILGRKSWGKFCALAALAIIQIVLGLYFTYHFKIPLNQANDQNMSTEKG